MKKVLALAVAALVSVAGAFALDLGGIEGTWKDEKWDANWTFNASGTITLSIASTGETVYTFSDSNISNFKANASVSGVSLSFSCADTNRSYKFTKPASLSTDLEMHIDPNWTDTDYDTKIKFQK